MPDTGKDRTKISSVILAQIVSTSMLIGALYALVAYIIAAETQGIQREMLELKGEMVELNRSLNRVNDRFNDYAHKLEVENLKLKSESDLKRYVDTHIANHQVLLHSKNESSNRK